jgi:hypothetical protein
VARQRNLPAELSEAKRLAGLEKRLPALLAGADRLADNGERLEVGELCRRQQRFAAAVRFWAEAFAADAKLADDLKTGHRYQAATAAARAAAGQGRDAGTLKDPQKASLRKRALEWLKADLAARANQPAGERAALLRHWQKDPDLAPVRDPGALGKLPEAEQVAWRNLWSQVDTLLARTGLD